MNDNELKPVQQENQEDNVFKIQSSNGLTTGSFTMPVDGTVLITFDNRHSFFRAKHVQYRFEITIPDSALENNAEDGNTATANSADGVPDLPQPEE